MKNRKEIINSVIRDYVRNEYVLGKNDCALMAVRIIKEISGKDLLPLIEGKYSDTRSINRLILQHGKDFRSAVSNALEIEAEEPRGFMPGDIVLYYENGIPHLGFCQGKNAIFLGERGLVRVPVLECACRWRLTDA